MLKVPIGFLFSVRDLFNEWTIELKGMADRIISMRQQLFDALRSRGKPIQSSFYNSFIFLSFWNVPGALSTLHIPEVSSTEFLLHFL